MLREPAILSAGSRGVIFHLMRDSTEQSLADAAPESAPAGGLDVVLRVSGLAKSFGATEALRDCSLELRRGEVLAIMGENASGKSTLVKILSGVHRPDRGTLEVLGQSLPHLTSPGMAQKIGIATVFQEILIVAQQTVLTNIWLGRDGLLRRRIPVHVRRDRGRDVLTRLIDDPRLDMVAARLALSDRQAVCIARALVREPRILILDEATSALDVATRDRLFDVMRELRAAGTSILFISHRMDEVEEIADRVSVMRSGRTVATLTHEDATPRRLVALMTGVEDAGQEIRPAVAAHTRVRDTVVVRTRGVCLNEGSKPIDVEVKAGELVGVAGLEGHGQDGFLRVLAGVPPPAGEVECLTGHAPRALRSPAEARAAGIAYVPRDRRDESIFETRSILENFQVTTLEADRRRGLLRRAATEKRFDEYTRLLNIRTGHRSNPITSLSGGTQQKVVIARWLATKPRILLLNDPTRGVDMATKSDIYRVLRDAAAEGVAVVMLSTEVIELIELMDRVLVFREGEVFTELAREELSRPRLVAAYFGAHHE
jgi:ABC-type sugar transport system ATPase subunit